MGFMRFTGSGGFIITTVFIMALHYAVEAMKQGQGVLLSLFNNPLFLCLFILLLIGLCVRGFYRKDLTCVGLVLVLFSLYLSTGTVPGTVVLKEGEERAQLRLISVKGIPEKMIIIGKERPEGFRNIEAEIISEGRIKRLKPFPYSLFHGRAFVLWNAGISPDLEIRLKGRLLREDRLSVLPPEKTAKVSIKEGVVLTVSLSPERVYKKGRLELSEYNLRRPLYRILLKDNDGVLFERLLRDHEEVHKTDFSIILRDTAYWAELRQRDIISLLPFYTGLFLIIAGAITSLLRKKKTA